MSDVIEPTRRHARVRDAGGRTWERQATLWHHRPARGEDWAGRWPWYAVLQQFGPLTVTDSGADCGARARYERDLGRVRAAMEAADARYLAEHGLTPDVVDRLKSALSEGTYSTDDGTPPYLDGSAKLPDIVALHEAGFRASHALTWRWAGCRSAADVLRAIEAGITPTIADELTRQYGGRLGRWGKRPGLRSVDELLRLHSGGHDPVD